MPKINYNGITFDSELEVEYYKYLLTYNDNPDAYNSRKDENGRCIMLDGFVYHPMPIENLIGKRSYTPDFILLFDDHHAEIIECKGYNPYSKMIDDQIHNVMLSKSEHFLTQYVLSYVCQANLDEEKNAGIVCDWYSILKANYRKIKYLKAYGFVDWDFKNPNTLANKRKEKINDLSAELKELKEFKKNALRYWNYKFKQACKEKLTKKQEEWLECYGCDMIQELRKAKNNE